jgi:hypothetical protein
MCKVAVGWIRKNFVETSFEADAAQQAQKGGVLRALAYVDCEEVEQEIGVGLKSIL